MLTNEEIIKRVREIAWSKGLSLTKIEEQLKWSNGKMGKWASAKKLPPMDQLVQVAGVLEVPLSEITGEINELAPTHESELDEAIISRLCQLTPEEMQKVDAFVQGLIAARKD